MRKEKAAGATSRRRFLKGVGSGTVATIVATGNSALMPQVALAQEPATPAAPGAGVQLRRCRLPVLRRTDVLVIGGSTAAVAAALGFHCED